MSYLSRGQFGFTFTPPVNATTDPLQFSMNVLSASSPDPGGTTWGITLASWQGPVPRQELGIQLVRALVQWGGGGLGGSGGERALIDYPTGGTTVMVHGTDVKVDIVGVVAPNFITDVAPILSGWLSHGPTAARQMTATLTEEYTIATGTRVFVVPPRARAVRLLDRDQNGIRVQITQLSGQATPVTEAVDVPVTAADGGVASYQASNRAAWIPLAPATATIVVTPADVNEQVRVQWVLELG